MGKEIAKVSALCMKAAQEQLKVEHPDYPGIGITIAELHGPTDNPNADWKGVNTVFTGELDFENQKHGQEHSIEVHVEQELLL
jgi:proline racemase